MIHARWCATNRYEGNRCDCGLETYTEQDAKLREALADPARFEIVVTGRNGFVVRHGFPLFDYEDGEISSSIDTKRREIRELGFMHPTGLEPLPYSRVITYTLTTHVRGEQP